MEPDPSRLDTDKESYIRFSHHDLGESFFSSPRTPLRARVCRRDDETVRQAASETTATMKLMHMLGKTPVAKETQPCFLTVAMATCIPKASRGLSSRGGVPPLYRFGSRLHQSVGYKNDNKHILQHTVVTREIFQKQLKIVQIQTLLRSHHPFNCVLIRDNPFQSAGREFGC